MSGPIIPIFTGDRARLLTFDQGVSPRDPMLNPLRVDIADLIAWIAARDPQAVGSWRQLSSEEYARSFAVARTAGYSVIADLYQAFRETLESGGTEVDYSRRVLPVMQAKGWLAGTGENVAARVRLIYDTNLRVSRSAGRWQRYMRTARTFPYLRGVTARDERVRRPPRSQSDHNAFDGLILPIVHPFWTRYFVPLGFRCRCSVIQMTRSQLARWPGGVASEEKVREVEARLGPPIFAAPGSFDAQLADIAAAANDKRLPGQPAFGLREARAGGDQLLNAAIIDSAADEIADLLGRLFGPMAA